MAYEVFISYKHSGSEGGVSRDYQIAQEVYSFLSSRGLKVFFSDITLEAIGTAEYKPTIDDALDSAKILVVVGTSADNLASKWVRYEWDGFSNDILSGFKQGGKVFAYIEGVEIASLPWALRHTQVFQHSSRSLEILYGFIATAFGREAESEVDWLLSARDSIRMLNSDIADRLALDLTPPQMVWIGLIPALTTEAWNMGHLVVDLDDMRAEILRREQHDISQSIFEAAVHTFCIPLSKGERNPMHYLLYTPLPHLCAINQPVLFRSWYAQTGTTLRTIFPLPQTPRAISGEREKTWCDWLESLLPA
jgi:hypothetical protein